MNIVIPIFDRITALDAIGPYEVLSRLPDARVQFVAPRRGEVRTDNRALGLIADLGIDEVDAADLLLVPGGYGERLLERDPRMLAWLRAIDRSTRITASVCTGALLLGAAGLLRGRRATTHWALHHRLAELGPSPPPSGWSAQRNGTFHYWAATEGRTLESRRVRDSQLGGAIVVDPPGTPAPDRVFVLGLVASDTTVPEVVVINGRSWPHTERLTYAVGDTARWRVVI